MHKVQILTTRPWRKLLPISSWLIRLTELSKESHVVWYFPEKQIIRDVYFNNFREMSIDRFMEKNRLVNMRTLTLTNEQYQKLNSYTESKSSKQNKSFFAFCGLLVSNIFNTLFKKRLPNLFKKPITSAEYIREGGRKIDELAVFLLTHDIPRNTFNNKDALFLASVLSDKY